MTAVVPLSRSFTLVPAPYQDHDFPLEDLWASLGRGEGKRWDALLQEFRVVILADAGAGKTHELRAAASRLIAAQKPAFFLRIEDIDSAFGTAFEVGSPGAFDAWLHGTDEAWFFLDSVDELRLARPRAFEEAIRAFAARLQGALQRAHVYISSRPYAWRSSLDRALINEILPHQELLQEVTGEEPEDVEEAVFGLETDEPATATQPEPPPTLQVYLLAPLDDADIRLFAAANGVTDIDAFLAALEHRNLLTLAGVPFDLLDLLSAWRNSGALGNRLAVLQDSVRRLLAMAVPDGRDLSQALDAVRLLASASTLTGIPNFALPGVAAASAIDPGALLSDWSDPELTALLGSGVFGDPLFGEVRFRHREVRDLLAAEWAGSQLGRVGGRARLTPFIFHSSYGLEILPPRLRPLLPWLILFDATIRDRMIAKEPAIAIEGGDAASLPLAVRETVLGALLEAVASPVDPLRGLDNEALARIAQPDLEDFVLGLIARHGDSDNAVFVLGRLVWQGGLARCLPPLIAIASDPARGFYARLVSIRAVATLGSPAQIHGLWQTLNESGEALPRRLIAEFADHAPVDAETVALLLASLERLVPRKQFEPTGLNQALSQFIARIPLDPTQSNGGLVLTFAAGLQRLLDQEPYIERGECHVSEEYQWLMGPALHLVERLIEARSLAALDDVSLAILAAVPALRFWRDNDVDDRKSSVDKLIPAWPELNDALFWWVVAGYRSAQSATGGKLDDDWPITFIGHFWDFDAASFPRTLAWIAERGLMDDRLVALSRSFTTYAQAGRPPEWLADLQAATADHPILVEALAAKLSPPASPETKKFARMERQYKKDRAKREREEERDRSDFVAEVTANPEHVRTPPGVGRGQFARIHYNLLRILEGKGRRSSRAQGANWRALIPEFGSAVAEAYRDAAMAYWRKYKPGLRSKGTYSNQIPYALIFAMAGIDIELDQPGAAASFSPADTRRAFRYAPWELNGFPRWFETLYRAKTKIGRKFLWTEIEWELANTPADESLHYMLSTMVYYTPWLHAEVGPLLYDWLRSRQAPSLKTLAYMRTIIVGGGSADATAMAQLARDKLLDAATPLDQRPTWFALWVDSEPAPAIQSLERLFDSSTLADPSAFAQAFVVALLGGRSDTSPVHSFGNYRTPTHLAQLYLLMHQAMPVAGDIERAGGGVYSPTLRDDAQDARERLLQLLVQIPGSLSYNALVNLSRDHPVANIRSYLAAKVYEHAVADGDLAPWSVPEVSSFAGQLAQLPSGDPINGDG